MAKIENTTAYPTVTPAADDLLIGTDVNNNNETVTFKISDIVGAGGVAQDLQSVLDTGNIATQNITLTGDIKVIGTIWPTTITAQGNIGNLGQILSSTGAGIEWIDQPTVTCHGIPRRWRCHSISTERRCDSNGNDSEEVPLLQTSMSQANW